MAKNTFRLNGRAALLGLIAAAYPVLGYTAPAARVDFATGDVKAIGANGQSRTLSKGAQIEQGETISTNNGRAHLRFTDGAYVALQPESEFRIDQYRFDGKQDGNEKGFFSLVKGGLRTITGLVGRTNKNAYQVTTSVATIGIRGTEYTIQYGKSVTGSVGEGEIDVCNGAGCMNVTNGESYYVQNQDVKPILTNKRTDFPPPPPQGPVSTLQQGENVDESGSPCSIGGACGDFLTGTGQFHVGTANHSSGQFVSLNANAVVNNGQLEQYDDGTLVTLSAPFTSVGGDKIIAWGTAANCSGGECNGMTHYAVGQPTSFTQTQALGGMTGTYSLMGGTAITDSSGNSIGALRSGSLNVNFQTGFVSGTMTTKMDFMSMQNVTSSMNVSGSGPSLSFGTSSGAPLNVFGSGFFAGSKAERFGFVYRVDDGQHFGVGAGGMKQDKLTASPPN